MWYAGLWGYMIHYCVCLNAVTAKVLVDQGCYSETPVIQTPWDWDWCISLKSPNFLNNQIAKDYYSTTLTEKSLL